MARLHDILPRRNDASDLYIWALQQAYENGVRLYDPDFALVSDPAAPEKIRRDPIIKQAIHDRLTNAAGGHWACEAATESEDDKLAAAIMEDLVRCTDGLQMARYRLANAIVDGRAYAEIRGQRRVLSAGPADPTTGEPPEPMDWWAPDKLKDIDPRRVRWVPRRDIVTGEDLSVELQVRSIERRDWVVVSDEARAILVETVFEDSESRLGYGRGLRDALYHYYWAKGVVLREGLQALEKWAQGWPVVKVDLSDNSPGGSAETTDDLRTKYLKMLKSHRARFGGIVVDKNDEVDIKFPSGSGHQMVKEWLSYLDSAITRLVTGALLPSGGGSDTGSLARGQVEENTQERVVQFDRTVVDESLTRSLITLIWRTNRENFVALGLGDANMPRFKTINQKREDPEQAVNVISTALAAGVELRKDEVYRKLGFTQPAEDDEVFEGGAADADPFGGLSAEFGDEGVGAGTAQFKRQPKR